jgi:hypothetical protein
MSEAGRAVSWRRVCRVVLAAFCLLYLAALALYAIGSLGLFGSPRGPLAGIFLVLLGLPWVLLLDLLPDQAGVLAAILAPGLTAGLLALLCRSSRS